ncbi:PPK2 family polyphosphate kinase [Neomicrococcus lactis]|uniref:PPK2 family polyphosphate:nucleotide phosphotransferase n=1 Tax=Neomicrococcus lactis TaxID=732241 RepID=A0A7W8Y8Z0_9MICC|nr:PPK2 family polyphosphate kinase [Neomicrococcus lactis]MBB5597131.1 PPK2 family polyphosphate:nucleotide phosphotransferase [Neomicrococcus lactis]
MAKKTGFVEDPTPLLRAGRSVDLSSIDPNSTPGFNGKKADGQALLAAEAVELSELQERLFAASREGAPDRILLVLQAMDTAGKGGIVRHVVGAVDPQGIEHHAFKAPTDEEKKQDFLWRIEKQLPGPGIIGVFDRSHYEDVLVHRVKGLSPQEEITRRYGAIKDFERDLVAQGTRVIKVMLHISREEQGARLMERLERPDKYWKYNPGDLEDRGLWDQFQEAYQIALRQTDLNDSPWYVVPANKKWYARVAVQRLLLNALKEINPTWPPADFDVEEEKKKLAAS